MTVTDGIEDLHVCIFDDGRPTEEECVVEDGGEEVPSREVGHDQCDVCVVEEDFVERDDRGVRENERMEGYLAEMERFLRGGCMCGVRVRKMLRVGRRGQEQLDGVKTMRL